MGAPSTCGTNRRQLRRSTFIRVIRVIRAIRGQTLLRCFRERPTPGIPAWIGALKVRHRISSDLCFLEFAPDVIVR